MTQQQKKRLAKQVEKLLRQSRDWQLDDAIRLCVEVQKGTRDIASCIRILEAMRGINLHIEVNADLLLAAAEGK